MKRQCYLVSAVGICLIAVACMQQVAVDTKAPRITKEELMSIMEWPNVVIVDVRVERDWKTAELKMKGAVREDPEKDIKSWAMKYPKDKTLVFY